MDNIFDVLILVGRPGSGKSEIVDFLSGLQLQARRRRYHIGEMDALDDFPLVWDWFEQDEILSSRLGRPHLFTDKRGYFKHPSLWHLLVERLALAYHRRLRNDPAYHTHTTALVEFSRGKGVGGYHQALPHLGEEILNRAAVLYVNTSFAESLRKNRLRYNPDRPDSILEHGLSDEKMEKLYKEDDWSEIAPGSCGFLDTGNIRLPFVVFENEDDVTTGKPGLLSVRLESVLNTLWELRQGS